MRARLRPFALTLVSALALGGVVAVAAPAVADPANTDQLAVTLAGDSSVAADVAAPVSIVNYTADGTKGTTVALPTADSGANHQFTLNADEAQQGTLAQSTDHSHVVLGGYDAAVGTADLNGSTAAAVPRAVASVDASGNVDTSTLLGGAFSQSHVRGVASTNGEQFWVGGKGSDDAPYGGLVYVTDGATTSTVVVGSTTKKTDANNTRVPVIANGQLYAGSDRTSTPGITKVGSGLPTTLSTQTVVAAQPTDGTGATPQGYVFAGDALYVSYTEGTAPGIVKYVQSGGTWTPVGSSAGSFWGLTGRVAGNDVVLYATSGASFGNSLVELYDNGGATGFAPKSATIATAPADKEFRGVAFAAGFTPGTAAVPVPGATPTFAWTASATNGTGQGLAGVVGAQNVADAHVTVTDPDGSAISSLAVTDSTDATVADAADTTITAGADGAYTIAVDPKKAGTTTLTLTATTADGRTGTSTLQYGALAPLTNGGDALHLGVSDASAAVSVGDGYFLVGDDDSSPIRLYGPSGYQVNAFDFASQVGIIQAGESWDLESVAVQGDTLYWLGSLGPSRKGNVKPDRDTIVETKVVGSGASTTLQYVSSAHGITAALVAWDQAGAGGKGANYYGFAEALASGEGVSSDHSLNVEGSAFSPDGSTLWLGFRSPLVPPTDRKDALIIGIDNIQDVLAGTATPEVGDAFTLDLGGRAIRDIRQAGDGNYLISAGGADDNNSWALYGWDGKPTDAPVQSSTVEDGRGLTGSWEGIIDVPSLADGTTTSIVQDDGSVDLYGNGTQAADLDQDLKAFSSSTLTLDFDGAFGAAAPGTGTGTGTNGGTGAGTGDVAGNGGTGTDADGTGSQAATTDPAAGTTGSLAFTGTDGTVLAAGTAGGLLLLLLGIGVLVARRRRRGSA